MTKIDIDQVKSALPMPELMNRLGLGDHSKRKAKCPWHEDNSPSFSVFQGENGAWFYKCHAGCGEGDEVKLVEKALGLSTGEAILRYADLAGIAPSEDKIGTPGKFIREALDVFPSATVVATDTIKQAPPCATGTIKQASACVISPLAPKAIEQVAAWRGLSLDFVAQLSNEGKIGTHEKQIAFPVSGGLHYRKKDGSWRYTEGAKPDLFVIGEIEEGAHVHCFESQWDALALADSQGEDNNTVATRGAGNVRRLDQFLNYSGTLYLWPQNDEPGQKWASDIVHDINCQMKLVSIPREYKDLSEWRKDGKATDGDIWNAIISAKDYEETTNTHEANQRKTLRPIHGSQAEKTKPQTVEADAKELSTAGTEDSGAQGQDNKAGQLPRLPQADNSETATRPSLRLQQPVISGVDLPSLPFVKASTISDGGQLTSGRAAIDAGGALAGSNAEGSIPSSPTNNLAGLLDQALEYLKRYTVFRNEAQATVCALWAAHTWVYNGFDYSPILHIYSPEKGCGKSGLLQSLGLICRRASEFVNTSEAALYREIERDKPTMLWDEIDQYFTDDKSPIVGILNAGYQTGGKVKRCAEMGADIVEFNVYCPKALTGIGKIPDTTHSRSLDIRLIRENKGTGTKFRRKKAEPFALPIREAFGQWAEATPLDTLTAIEPELPEQLSGRQQDITESLFAIAELAGDDWKERARQALVTVCSTSEDQSLGVKLLVSIREAFEFANKARMSTAELLERLVSMETAETPWAQMWERDITNHNTRGPAHKIAELLSGFDIEPKVLREDGNSYRGYQRLDFEDAWERYLSPITGMETIELGI